MRRGEDGRRGNSAEKGKEGLVVFVDGVDVILLILVAFFTGILVLDVLALDKFEEGEKAIIVIDSVVLLLFRDAS